MENAIPHEWAARYPVWVPIQVRYRDLDALAHVNNAVYFSYLELARVKYVEKRIGPVKPQDYTFVIARLELDFLAPLHLHDAPAVGIKPRHAGRSSFSFDYVVIETQTGRYVARGQSVQVFIDRLTGRPQPLPAIWRTALEADLAHFPPDEPASGDAEAGSPR